MEARREWAVVTSAISISCAALDIGVGALGFGLAGWGTPHGTGGGGAEGGGGRLRGLCQRVIMVAIKYYLLLTCIVVSIVSSHDF